MPQPSPNPAGALEQFYTRHPQLRDSWEVIEDGVEALAYAEGDRLFNRGSPVTHLFWVLDGSVEEGGGKRTDRQLFRRLRRIVRAGQLLGLYDFLAEQPHSTHAVAAEETQVLRFGVRSFERLLFSNQRMLDLFGPLRVLERLRTIPLMSALDPIERWYAAEAVQWRRFAPGELLFDASTTGTNTFLIDQGQVQVTDEQGEMLRLGNGAVTGLPGLDASARAITAVSAFMIPSDSLLQLTPDPPLVDMVAVARQLRQDALAMLQRFIPTAESKQLLGFVSHYFLPDPQLLLWQGEQSDSMWVLMPDSHAHVLMPYRLGGALKSTPVDGPNTFADTALTATALIPATVAATANSHWLRLHHADFTLYQQLVGSVSVQRVLPANAQDRAAETHYRFPWLQSGERVLWPSRRHWLVLIRKTWVALVLLALSFTGYTVLSLVPGLQIGLVTVMVGVGVVGLALFLWGFYDYWNDYIVVTNRRFVRQEHVLLQSIHLQETGLEQIRNVDISKTFTGQLLGYGLLEVQTAGPQGTIAFDFVPAAAQIQRILIEQMNERRHFHDAAGKVDILYSLEGRLGLRMVLPERVYEHEPASPSRRVRTQSWLTWTGFPLGRRSYDPYQGERVVWRKHWLVLLLKLFWPVLFLAGLIVLLFGELLLLPTLITGLLTGPSTVVIAVLALIDLGVIAWRFADWRNDTYEVTRDEVADVERLPLFFDEQRRTARLTNIDNIRTEIPGTLHYLFNVGNVRLETAAVQGEFTFDWVANPNGVAAEIRRRIEEARRREERERSRQRARELSDWFELYDRLQVERG